MPGSRRPVIRIERIVAQRGVLDQQPYGIDAKAIDAALEPEPEHVIHRCAHRRIAPVEIGLLAKEAVQIILPGWRIEGPGRPAELR